MTNAPLSLLVLVASLACCGAVAADEFTVQTDDGEAVKFVGSVYADVPGLSLLQRPNGMIEMVPDGRLVDRTPGDDPPPIEADGMIELLKERFAGPQGDLLLTSRHDPYVVALVLQAPLDRGGRARGLGLLRKAGTFLLDLERSFTRFATRMDLPKEEPAYPLVMIIFETDAQFEDYAVAATGGRGLSAERINGFYSSKTNWLAVRLDECDDFQLPLHEGIHQQVYNRGWFRRFADIPVWFDEGIATGFEADGGDVDTDPRQLNGRNAVRALESKQVSFAKIIEDDSPFRGDVLAGEAYMQAWALHWLLVGSRPEEYTAYVTKLGQRQPLERVDDDGRKPRFEEAFNVTVADLEAEFRPTLEREARLQRVRPPSGPKPGEVFRQDQMGQVALKVVGDGSGRVRAAGSIKNVSPLRALQYRVRLEPPTGESIEWVTPPVSPRRTFSLPLKQMITNDPSFRTTIESSIPGSRDAAGWSR